MTCEAPVAIITVCAIVAWPPSSPRRRGSSDDNRASKRRLYQPSFPERLDTAIEWIKANLSPDDVFDESQLAEHARSNIEIDDVYSESNILGYVAGTFNPVKPSTPANWKPGLKTTAT